MKGGDGRKSRLGGREDRRALTVRAKVGTRSGPPKVLSRIAYVPKAKGEGQKRVRGAWGTKGKEKSGREEGKVEGGSGRFLERTHEDVERCFYGK